MKFEELDLNDNVLDALYDMHFEECTPVQEHCIPPILEGKDLLGVAQTGTGKTAAYLLPILSLLDDGGYPDGVVNCLIMSPTRELAQQIDQAMQGFAYYTPGVSSVAVYGGNDGNRFDQEVKSMRLGADVIIATPGRLISHLSLGNVDLSKLSFFVLDEADRMLDMGFSEDIMKIASYLPDSCQTIMFSATMPKDIEKLAQNLLKNPVEVKLAVSKPAEKIKQQAYICYETQKLQIIKDIFKNGDLKRVIIFSGSKQKVKHINQALQRLKIASGEMHSDLTQEQRDDIMFKFKSGQIDVLVATDIVARGIDIDDITLVINFDVPHDAEDYVHRIGRTARADRDGQAITFVNEDDMYAFYQIEKFLEKEVEKLPLPAECGEGPEYTTTRRSKTSAKSRRRNDRNTNAHRRKPRNDNNQRQPKDENRKDAAGQKPENGQPRQNNGEQKAAPVAGEGQQPRKSRRRRRRPQSAGTQENAGQPRENKQPDQNGEQKQGQRNGQQNNNRRRNNRQRNNNARRNDRNAKGNMPQTPAQAPTAQTPAAEKRDSGISSLLKRPLKWIRSIGKHK